MIPLWVHDTFRTAFYYYTNTYPLIQQLLSFVLSSTNATTMQYDQDHILEFATFAMANAILRERAYLFCPVCLTMMPPLACFPCGHIICEHCLRLTLPAPTVRETPHGTQYVMSRCHICRVPDVIVIKLFATGA